MAQVGDVIMNERRVKVDPDVAYESGLCKQCEPTKPSSWSVGALFWIQIVFFSLIVVLIILMVAASYLCDQYTRKHGSLRIVNRRRLH